MSRGREVEISPKEQQYIFVNCNRLFKAFLLPSSTEGWGREWILGFLCLWTPPLQSIYRTYDMGCSEYIRGMKIFIIQVASILVQSSRLTFFIQWIKLILNFWLSTHLFSNSYLIILLLPGHHPQTLPGTLASQGPKWNLPARGAEVGPGSHAL